ncbi:MAG: PAS domain-containing protein [Candidatus Omnitrophota bacterium]
MPVRILLIEDDPDHIIFTRHILEKANKNFLLETTNSPQEGIQNISKGCYDIIICDYLMPEMTALDILRKINQENKDIPFIVVTSSGNEKVAVDLMKEGAYDYVIKDLSYEEVLPAVIERSIERYRIKKEREHIEKILRKNEEQFRTLIRNIPGAVYRCENDKELTMKFISEEIENISGYPASDFIQNYKRTFSNIIHPDDRMRVGKEIEDALSNNKPYILQYRILHADGQIRWIYSKGQGVFSKNDGVIWQDGVIFDTTDLKKQEEEKKSLARFPSENPSPVLRISRDGTLLYANSASSNILSDWRCEKGRCIPEAWHDLVKDALNTRAKRVTELKCKDKTFTVTLSPSIESNDVNMYAFDITLRKKAEKKARGRLFRT